MADMVGYNNVQTHFLSAAQHAGLFVYTSRCKELGVIPTSRVLDAIACVRTAHGMPCYRIASHLFI